MWIELPVVLDQAPFVPKKRDLEEILKEDGDEAAYMEALSKEQVRVLWPCLVSCCFHSLTIMTLNVTQGRELTKQELEAKRNLGKAERARRAERRQEAATNGAEEEEDLADDLAGFYMSADDSEDEEDSNGADNDIEAAAQDNTAGHTGASVAAADGDQEMSDGLDSMDSGPSSIQPLSAKKEKKRATPEYLSPHAVPVKNLRLFFSPVRCPAAATQVPGSASNLI